MRKPIRFLLISILLFSSFQSFVLANVFSGLATESLQAEGVDDRQYVGKVRQLIASANQSLDLSVETMALSSEAFDPVAAVLEDLILAAKRGVTVRLFLNTFSSATYNASAFLREDMMENLRKNGVEIHFVNPRYHLSDRLVIVDQTYVLEGGPDWTEEGFEHGLASATLVHSPVLGDFKRRRLEMLPLWNIKSHREQRVDGVLSVPLFLLKEIGYFPSMIRSEDEDAMKTYLALLRMFYATQQLEMTVSLEELSHQLPGEKFYEDSAAHFQTFSALERLDQRYGLIKLLEEGVDEMKIRMILPRDLSPVVGVPMPFFEENYAKDLTPQGIYVYMLVLYRMQMSGQSPVWLGSETNLQQDFPIATDYFRLGIDDLRRANLLEIYPFFLKQKHQKGSLQKPEFRYLLNNIPSLSERLETWDRLRDYYDDVSFKKARKLASLLGEPDDPKVIVTYMDFLQKFSIEDVRSLTQHVAELSNLKSTPEMLDYLYALLQNETQRNYKLATY